MTETTTRGRPPGAEEGTVRMHPAVHDEAEEFIRTMAAVAGDSEAVYGHLRDYCHDKPTESALGGLAAVVAVIFVECITAPVDPGEYAALPYPTA